MSLAERYGRFLASRPMVLEDGRDRRRDAAIIFYAGRNGSGKSLACIFDSLPDLDAGRRVLSTVRITDYLDPRPCEDWHCPSPKHGHPDHLAAHKAWEPWRTWRQLLELRDGVAIADEITGVADSSVSALPPLIIDELAQLRRADVVLRVTGLNYIRAHKRIREATQAVVQCSGSFTQEAFHDDGRPRLHKRRRLVRWVTYNAEDIPIENPSESAFENADELHKCAVWVPDSVARRAYDTFDSVSRIETEDKSGPCPECGGYCPKKSCECEHHAHAQQSRRTARRRASGEDGPPELLPEPVPVLARSRRAPALGAGGLAG